MLTNGIISFEQPSPGFCIKGSRTDRAYDGKNAGAPQKSGWYTEVNNRGQNHHFGEESLYGRHCYLTLLHSERPQLLTSLAFLSAIG